VKLRLTLISSRDFGLSFRIQGDMNICRHVTRVPLVAAEPGGGQGWIRPLSTGVALLRDSVP